MATNPNAIFGEALATGPRQVPLSDLLTQQAQRQNIQSEIAERAQNTQGLAQQNVARQRQLDDDAAVRATIARYTKTVPVTAPNVSMPSPGADANGNPLPMSSDQHAQAAAGAVQAPHVDYDGAYLDLLSQGRIAAADTLKKTRQALETQDLENNKAKLALFEQQNQRRNELVAPVINADPDKQDLMAAEVGQQLAAEGLGGGVGFTKEQARDLYARTSGLVDPITKAKAGLGLTEAQTENYRAEAAEKIEQTRQFKLSNDAAAQFLKNPDAVLGPGGTIDQLKLPKEDTQLLKTQLTALYQAPGTLIEKAKGVQQAIQSAVASVREEQRNIREKTNPAIINAEAQKGALTEAAKARLAGGPVAGILNPTLQQMALKEQATAEDAYHKAEGQAEQLHNFVDLARSPQGNQVAAGMLPVAVVRDLVNRVNNNELKLAGGGVSVARRLENWLSKGAAGKPSEDTLKDMEGFADAVLNSQGDVYRGAIAGIKRRFPGSTFDPNPPTTARTPATTQPAAQPAAVPVVGGTFNGEKVLKVTKIK